jgi:hypothetical protein
LPLFFIYEAGILFLSNEDIVIIRNGADFLLKNNGNVNINEYIAERE